MHLEIITPDKNLFKGDVEAVNVPGAKGSFTVLNNHAPIISTLEKGKITVTGNNDVKSFEIVSGIIEVKKNKIVVLAETA